MLEVARKSWVFYSRPHATECPDARDAADGARKLLRDGRDPIDVKVAGREAARKTEAEKIASAKRERSTLARVARAYHQSTIEPSRTPVHSREWIAVDRSARLEPSLRRWLTAVCYEADTRHRNGCVAAYA